MEEVKHISSTQNTLVKKIVLLRDKSKERKKAGLFILEGKRELKLALKSNYIIESLLINEKLTSLSEVQKLLETSASTSIISVISGGLR